MSRIPESVTWGDHKKQSVKAEYHDMVQLLCMFSAPWQSQGPFIREKLSRGFLWPWLIRGERNHLYECRLHKTRTAGINGSRLSPWPDQSNDDVVCFGASEQTKKRNEWLWSGKSPYFTLSFSFQINIAVKFSARLLRNVCGNLVEKFVSNQSVEWIKRDVPAMHEVEKMDETSGSLVKQVIFPPMQRASLGRDGLVCNWKQSMCEHVQQSFTASASCGKRMSAFIRTLSDLSWATA